MALLSAQIEQFRCIEHAELDLDSRATLITGPNGSGKTSVLEALYVLGRGRSFRTARLDTAVRHGQKQARVVGALERAGRRLIVGVETGQGETIAHIGGAPADSLAELSTVLPVQAIDPGVHKLIEEGPFRRRRFLDWGVFHVEQGYLQIWHRFHRALRQRNAALRQHVPDDLLDPWDQELFVSGTAVSDCRQRYFERLRATLQSAASGLLDLDVTVEYLRGWPADRALHTVLVERRALDLSRRTTTVGPHRADIDIRINGKRARETVSRGQQKLLAAALILGQLVFHRTEHGLEPLLLLDDPAAELDAERLGRLLQVVANLHPQLVLTALQRTSFEGLEAPQIWFHVEQGRLTRML
jgi:DNA replication and repair protein RecF